jgi:hypothetical protein
MQAHKLRLDDLAVESFPTSEAGSFGGTVHGHSGMEDETEDGTILTICVSCEGSCPPKHTCVDTCPPRHSCVTCPPQYTCAPPCHAQGETEVTV